MQQVAVIEAPLEPALVVAGAGSGKTETMANRVLWLLANRHVRPSEILGLTFTRKAAGELSGRIRARIEQLAEAGLVDDDYDAFETPQVSTYNSFANSIFRDNAMLIGREGDGAVLGSASAWQLARSLVVASRDERLVELDKRVDDVTKAVLALSGAVAENIVDPNEVRAFAARFAALADLPGVGRCRLRGCRSSRRLPSAASTCCSTSPSSSREAKRRRGFIEFSDQVALALQIVRGAAAHPRPSSVSSSAWCCSTSTRTPALCRPGCWPSCSPGIRSWRSATPTSRSMAGAVRAPRTSSPSATSSRAVRRSGFTLSTSWRNGHDILAVANALVEPLLPHTRVRVERLAAGPRATDRTVDVTFEESVVAEAESAALWLKHQLATLEAADGEPPTAAMLFRARKNQSFFLEALRKRGCSVPRARRRRAARDARDRRPGERAHGGQQPDGGQ